MKSKRMITTYTLALFYFLVSCSTPEDMENKLFENPIVNNETQTEPNNLPSTNDSTNTNYPNYTTFNYLALGDSYTIGTSVTKEESYPSQLSKKLEIALSTEIKLTTIATNGWRTDNLKNALNTNTITPPYQLVTLLIGVNNQFQGKPFSQYENEFPELLNTALKLANNNNKHVIVISIPDYAYTPFGNSLNKDKVSKEIDEYNAFAKDIATQQGVTFINITDITRKGLAEQDLVADDGLHPSGLAYKKFVERLTPIILSQLKD